MVLANATDATASGLRKSMLQAAICYSLRLLIVRADSNQHVKASKWQLPVTAVAGVAIAEQFLFMCMSVNDQAQQQQQ